MELKEFNEKYYFHDSLIESIVFDNNSQTLTIVFDFCFWMQSDYQKSQPENGLLEVVFRDTKTYDGIQGMNKSNYWSVVKSCIENETFVLTVEDIEDDAQNEKYYELHIQTDSVEVRDLRPKIAA